MEFCTAICAKIDQVDLVAQAEQVGVTHFGAGDGPLLFSDPFQYLALAARDTSQINLGTMVTNPLTRIAPVTANSLATLNALAPGRTFLGIGTANNALRSMGHAPARVRELDQSLTVINGLLRGERTNFEWRGRESEVEFLADDGYYQFDAEMPLWVAAGGPKVLKLAAQHADALIYCVGPQPEFIQLVRAQLDRAVEEAGRPPGSVKLVGQTWFYQLSPGENYEDAVVKGFGSGPISSCIVNTGLMSEHVDVLGDRIVDASRDAAMAYLGDPTAPSAPHHLDVWRAYMKGFDPAHKSLITKELVDYWCLYGTPSELQEKAQVMHDNGVDLISVMFSDPNTAKQSIADLGSSILAKA